MTAHCWFWMMLAGALVALLQQGVCHAQTSGKGMEPWASNTHPTDKPQSHVEKIVNKDRHEYSVTHGGTMDGRSCRSPVGVWNGWTQTWESNRAIRMENVGSTDVVNPWLSNGRNNFRTLQEVVDAALTPDMTDGEKAKAIYFQEITHLYHASVGGREDNNPVKVFNLYGFNTCGDDSQCLAGLWRLAGMRTTPAHSMGHCVSHAFYDGGWHMFDGDMHNMYLLRDNETVANEQEISRDHDLIKRTHTAGIRSGNSSRDREWEAALFYYEGRVSGTRDCADAFFNMNMTLRPGEALVWQWGHHEPLKYHGERKPKYEITVANGAWEYRPDLTKDLWRQGALSVQNVRKTANGLEAEAGQTGTILWKMQSPYVFIGGRLDVQGTGAKFALSWDGKDWQDVTADLDKQFPSAGPPRYSYTLRCELPDGAQLKSLVIHNDVQMTPLGMPEMVLGKNSFVYTDECAGGRNVVITHEWVERSATKAPKAPTQAVFPPDEGKTDGTDFAFVWTPAEDPDGDRIADYHFMLSERSDMHYPLSPNFWRLTSKTGDRGAARFTLDRPGLLTHGKTYYWRVRAQDANGVWGPWSKTWSFTAEGAAYPVEVTLDLDKDRNIGTLRWKPNPVGRKPVTYRVYGSEEKGFTVSDKPYKVFVGDRNDGGLPDTFEANFVGETSETEMVVLGVGLKQPNSNRTYYRVVAVDENRKRSGASDYVVAPRPFVSSEPVTTAKVGQPYSYQLSSNRSIGQLTMRMADKKQAWGFWDVELPKFKLEAGPAWLKLDEHTGMLSGTPEKAGNVEVVLTASIDREIRKLDLGTLAWGREKIVSVSTEPVGSVTQSFVIKVSK